MTIRTGFLFAMLSAPLVVACGSDDSGGSSSGGGTGGVSTGGASTGGSSTGGTGGSSTGGSSTGGSSTGGSSTGGSSTGGSSTGGTGGSSTGGTGGSSTGGTGGSGGVTCQTYQGDTICSAQCSAFPATVDLGPTISLGTTGALLCHSLSPAVCFLTNNTYSDGPNACAQPFVAAYFDSTPNKRRLTTTTTTSHFKSASSGTIDSTKTYIPDVPDATEITLVVNDGPASSPGPNDIKVVLKFEGTKLTMTSAAKN